MKRSNLVCCTLTGMCSYWPTRADTRKRPSINAQVSWKLAFFLFPSDLLGQWVLSSAPSDVQRRWTMTLHFRAGLSLSETLHFLGTKDRSGTDLEVKSSVLIHLKQSCVMSSASHETEAHVQNEKWRCPVRRGSWREFLCRQTSEEGRSYVHTIWKLEQKRMIELHLQFSFEVSLLYVYIYLTN